MTTTTIGNKEAVDKAEILRLRAEGVSQRDVAQQMGCSKTYVVQVEREARSTPSIGLPVVDLAVIRDNPWQTRPIDEDFVQELADSIESIGLLEPMLGRPMDDGTVQQATGHHRVAAIRRLAAQGGWTGGVPMLLRPMTDAEMALSALEENDKRKNPNPYQQLLAYRRALDEIEGLTIQALADRLGKDRATLSNDLRILRLPNEVLERVASGEVPVRSARELLCLVSESHAHLDILLRIIREISETPVGRMPDWRATNVRQQVSSWVNGSRVAEWRRLEKGKALLGGSHSKPPTFDVDAFQAKFADQVHRIPNNYGDGSYLWTCATSDWKKWQSGAEVTGNKDGGQNKPAPRELRHLAADPVARKVLNGAVSPEISPKLTEEATADLGTRAKVVNLGHSRAGHALGNLPGLRDDGPPVYFPDIDECRKTCTFGATYTTTSYSKEPSLRCLNEDHWQEKLERGKEIYKRHLQERIDAEDSEDDKVAGRLLAMMPEPLGLPVAAALLGTVNFYENVPVEEEVGIHEMAYTPMTLRMVNRVLCLEAPEKPQGFYRASRVIDRDMALQALGSATPEICAVVASRLLTWTLRNCKDLQYDALVAGIFGEDAGDENQRG